MIVCESGGHANGLTYFIFRFLRRPLQRSFATAKTPQKSKQNVPILMGIFAVVAIGNNGKNCPWGSGASPDKAQENAERYLLCSLAYGEISQKIP